MVSAAGAARAGPARQPRAWRPSDRRHGVGRAPCPPERRVAEVRGVRRLGAYDLITARDPGGPAGPAAGPVLHARRGRPVGRGQRRAALPAARLLLRARATRARAAGPSWSSCSRTWARAPAGWASSTPGEALMLLGPLGAGFAARGRGTRPRAGGRRHRHRADAGAARRAARRAPRWCWASARPARTPRRPSRCSAACAAVVTDDGSAGRRGTGHRAPARATRRATRPPPSTPAARRRCWRRSGRCARSAGSSAQLALEAGMACGYGACFGCVVPTAGGLQARVRGRAGLRRGRAGTALDP